MNFSSSRLKAPEKKKQIDYDLSFDERGQASKETVVLGAASVVCYKVILFYQPS